MYVLYRNIPNRQCHVCLQVCVCGCMPDLRMNFLNVPKIVKLIYMKIVNVYDSLCIIPLMILKISQQLKLCTKSIEFYKVLALTIHFHRITHKNIISFLQNCKAIIVSLQWEKIPYFSELLLFFTYSLAHIFQLLKWLPLKEK